MMCTMLSIITGYEYTSERRLMRPLYRKGVGSIHSPFCRTRMYSEQNVLHTTALSKMHDHE